MKLLFDIGPGTMRRLLEAGTTINEIDVLLISHHHPITRASSRSFFSPTCTRGVSQATPFTLAAPGACGSSSTADRSVRQLDRPSRGPLLPEGAG